MTQYRFTIEGNQEDPDGNPVPFQRVIKGHMRAASVRYHEWAEHVRAVFGRAYPRGAVGMNGKIAIPKGSTLAVKVLILWRDEKHGDPDNVLKGILDALLDDDRHVNSGQWKVAHTGMHGRVHVDITVFDPDVLVE